MPSALVGTWQLESWTARDEQGTSEHPFGPSPTGLLVITADGWMSVLLTASDRPNFPTSSNPFGEPPEQSAAFVTCISYAGRYRSDGDRLMTTVYVSSIPNWVGTEQIREVELADDTLVLRPLPIALPPGSIHSGRKAADRDEPEGEVGRARRQVRAMAKAAPLRNELLWRRAR
jgi:hypothetical protein